MAMSFGLGYKAPATRCVKHGGGQAWETERGNEHEG
jgi:hypothetical protein